MAPLQRNVWVHRNELPNRYLHIEFNDKLTSEERIWFNDILIVSLYPKFQKIRDFADLLNGWKNVENWEKIVQVRDLFWDIWELKEAFTYLMPVGTLPKFRLPLLNFEIVQEKAAFGRADYVDYALKYDPFKKFRMILASEVERKAIKKHSYIYVLYALYMFRTYSYYRYPVAAERSLGDQIRYYFSCIVDANSLDNYEGSTQVLRDQVIAQIKFFQDIRNYVNALYEQDLFHGLSQTKSEWHCLIRALDDDVPYYCDRPFEDVDDGRGTLVRQKPIGGKGRRGLLTPFQILLGEICRTLAPNCKKALMDFKQFLLNIPTLSHVVINIGMEDMLEFREAQRRYFRKTGEYLVHKE